MQRRAGNGRPGKRRRTNGPKARKTSSTHASIADLQDQLDERTRERDEALEQWAATTEVLKVISHSTFDLQTVLASVVRSSGQLCRAENVQIFLRDGELYRLAADNGFSSEYQQYVREHPISPGRNTLVARTALEGKTIYIPDVFADSEYTYGGQQLAGYRTLLGVPLIRDGNCIGVLALTRSKVQPFTGNQIELVTNFAAQAVIAIENNRLLSELRRSLQQQTATSELLNVISRSKFDLQPILQSVVDTAAPLCRADTAVIFRLDEGKYRFATGYCVDPKYIEIERANPITPGPGTVVGRAAIRRAAVQIVDAMDDPLYDRKPDAEIGQVRSMIGVPLMREGEPIGVIALARRRVEPFRDREIELVSTFADQAAIAIENVRLFESVEARTRELAKSLEDLRAAQDRLVQTEKLASLGQLTAGIAHEIKNPLNFVNNFSAVSVELIGELRQLLAGAKLDNEIRVEISEIADTLQGNLDKVAQHGKRADSIVKNMLLHSRQGSGEQRPVNINSLVEESLNLAYHGARAEKQNFNINLERSLDPSAGEAELFPQEITRVLLNLISNGFYAAKRKWETNEPGFEPTLVATTKDLGDRVEIRIRDNGTGIPPEVKKKIFNPFFTTKPAGEGTGLGLSISHDVIVKQHGGSIEVDTQPGEFTEFRIILPRTAATVAKSGGRA
jgi:signal transduction histidine kinase